METSFNPGPSEQIIDASIFVSGESASDFRLLSPDSPEQGTQGRLYWYREILPGIRLTALCVFQLNRPISKIHVGNRDFALREPATSVQSDLESGSGPLGRIGKPAPEGFDLGVCQGGFNLLRGATNAELGNRVVLRKLTANRFAHNLREKLQFKQGGIMADASTVNGVVQSPSNKGRAVRVFELPGVDHVMGVEEQSQNGPRATVAPQRAGGFVGVVTADPRQNPNIEGGVAVTARCRSFLGRIFVSNPLGLPGIGCAGGMFNPLSRVGITAANIPKRGAGVLPDVSHAPRVHHSLSFEKDICGVSRGASVEKDGFPWAQIATITPRGYVKLAFSTLYLPSVSAVSHFGVTHRALEGPSLLQ